MGALDERRGGGGVGGVGVAHRAYQPGGTEGAQVSPAHLGAALPPGRQRGGVLPTDLRLAAALRRGVHRAVEQRERAEERERHAAHHQRQPTDPHDEAGAEGEEGDDGGAAEDEEERARARELDVSNRVGARAHLAPELDARRAKVNLPARHDRRRAVPRERAAAAAAARHVVAAAVLDDRHRAVRALAHVQPRRHRLEVALRLPCRALALAPLLRRLGRAHRLGLAALAQPAALAVADAKHVEDVDGPPADRAPRGAARLALRLYVLRKARRAEAVRAASQLDRRFALLLVADGAQTDAAHVGRRLVGVALDAPRRVAARGDD